MASRNELVIRGNAVGLTASNYPNDSKFEQKILYLEKNATTFAGALATGVLTSDNINVSNGDTVTIGDQTYTFKTVLTTTAGDVLIGADADASLLNLARCINQSGGTSGTDYAVTPVNRRVTCSTTVTAHAITVTAREYAFTNADVPTTKTSSHLSWGAATLTSGTRNQIAANTTTAAGSAGISGDKNLL